MFQMFCYFFLINDNKIYIDTIKLLTYFLTFQLISFIKKSSKVIISNYIINYENLPTSNFIILK